MSSPAAEAVTKALLELEAASNHLRDAKKEKWDAEQRVSACLATFKDTKRALEEAQAAVAEISECLTKELV